MIELFIRVERYSIRSTPSSRLHMRQAHRNWVERGRLVENWTYRCRFRRVVAKIFWFESLAMIILLNVALIVNYVIMSWKNVRATRDEVREKVARERERERKKEKRARKKRERRNGLRQFEHPERAGAVFSCWCCKLVLYTACTMHTAHALSSYTLLTNATIVSWIF